MVDGWRKRLRDAVIARGLDPKDVSRRAGRGPTFLRDVIDYGIDPSVEKLMSVLNVLNMTMGELIDGLENPPQRIPIIGVSEAGECWTPSPSAGETEMALTDGEPIAVEVRGDSMAPVYRDGDLIIGAKRSGAAADNLIGQDCIIETREGQRYIKFLLRGSPKGRYTLRAYNPTTPDIENVRLAWVAPILWVRRR